MRVLVLEDNLMWSARLRQSLMGLGHEVVMLDRIPEELPQADVAILNLGSDKLWSAELVSALKDQGAHVVGHAGHKEKQLLAAGREEGCDQVVSNSTLTFKLADVLDQAGISTRPTS